MIGKIGKLLEEAGHVPTAPVCPMPEKAPCGSAHPGPPMPPPMACGFPPGHTGPHRTVFGYHLRGDLVEREIITRCRKCRTLWPCDMAKDWVEAQQDHD